MIIDYSAPKVDEMIHGAIWNVLENALKEIAMNLFFFNLIEIVIHIFCLYFATWKNHNVKLIMYDRAPKIVGIIHDI